MQKATHINVGLTTSLLLLIKTLNFNIFYVFYLIISLFQDLDHPQGTLARKLGFTLPFKHRGFSHTLLFILIVQGLINAALFFWLDIKLTNVDQIILFVLLHAHLLADIWTVSGFPYLYPFYKWDIKIPGISIFKTGTNGEYFFNFVITALNIWLIYFIIKSQLLTKLVESVKSTQDLVLSSPKFLIVTLILFIIFGIHLISVELKNLKRDTVRLGKTIFSMLLTLTLTIVSVVTVSLLIQHFIFPEIDVLYFLLGSIVVTIFSAFALFNKHLEFISKSSGYLVNAAVLVVFFILTFNVFGVSDYLLK